MSGSPFGIFEHESANKQTRAMQGASQLEYEAAMAGVDAMLQMWEKAQSDFKPYLEAGAQGIAQLSQAMPQYLQSQMYPIAQKIAGYKLSQLPGANVGMVNPVTGQITQAQGAGGTGGSGDTMRAFSTAPGRSGSIPFTAQVPTWSNRGNTPRQAQGGRQTIPLGSLMEAATGSGGASTAPYALGTRSVSGSIGTPNLSRNVPVQDTGLARLGYAGAPSYQLEQGGVLAPTVPEFQRELNYQFDENDPTYQILLREKNTEIDNFLAKQGLQGSSAGESFRQRELDKLRASQDAVQYQRALGERNYLTQTDVDAYKLAAARGDTLYGRQMQAGSDLYNRSFNLATAGDERNLAQLANVYGIGSNLYGLQYGAGLDLAKLGAGAAGSAGAGSIQTGQNVNAGYQAGGAAQAQGALGQAAVWANYMNGLSQQGTGVANALMNRFGNQSGGFGSGSGGGSYNYTVGGGGNYGIGGTGGVGPGGGSNWANYV